MLKKLEQYLGPETDSPTVRWRIADPVQIAFRHQLFDMWIAIAQQIHLFHFYICPCFLDAIHECRMVPQARPDPREQLFDFKWLGHIIVRSLIKSRHLVKRGVPCRRSPC